ncbi:type II toxin-antitoxin system death-on-curing family toxin [Candidatus Dependentiae bacterium]|nr:type II toxin-antitoxin system death-on-curing family toxin [Candidatus Dependentiae bacterium]
MVPIVFLSCEVAIAINEHQVRLFGGLKGIRDMNLLESALARPQTMIGGVFMYPDLHTMAAVYAHGIIKNHPFFDGNKRTGMATALTFLNVNGHESILSSKDVVDIGVALATAKLSYQELAMILKHSTILNV